MMPLSLSFIARACTVVFCVFAGLLPTSAQAADTTTYVLEATCRGPAGTRAYPSAFTERSKAFVLSTTKQGYAVATRSPGITTAEVRYVETGLTVDLKPSIKGSTVTLTGRIMCNGLKDLLAGADGTQHPVVEGFSRDHVRLAVPVGSGTTIEEEGYRLEIKVTPFIRR